MHLTKFSGEGGAPARDGATTDVQDGVPGRRHPALPRPGHRHHHQTGRLRADQRGPRAARPGARVQPAAHRRRPVHLLLVPGRRLRGPGHRDPPRRRVRVRRVPEGRRGRHLLVRQGLATTCAATSTPPPWPATTCAPSPPGSPAPTRTSPNGSWPPPAPTSGPYTLAELRCEAHKTAATVRMVMSQGPGLHGRPRPGRLRPARARRPGSTSPPSCTTPAPCT